MTNRWIKDPPGSKEKSKHPSKFLTPSREAAKDGFFTPLRLRVNFSNPIRYNK
jgi:hypothetical protein